MVFLLSGRRSGTITVLKSAPIWLSAMKGRNDQLDQLASADDKRIAGRHGVPQFYLVVPDGPFAFATRLLRSLLANLAPDP